METGVNPHDSALLETRSALVYKGFPPDHCCVDQAFRIAPRAEDGAPGDWIVLFVTGGPNEPNLANHIVISRSRDEGATWSDADVVLRLDDRACLLTEAYVDSGRVVVFVSTHLGKFEDWRVWTIESVDGGRTWSEPEPFEPLPRRTFVRNRYVASSGAWLLPFQTYDTREDPTPSPLEDGSFKTPCNGTLISGDYGHTWEISNRITGRSWAENNLVERSDGSLVMLIRADGTGCLHRSTSDDRGRTWSEAEPTDIPNPGSKFRLFRLHDGRIVLLHNPNDATGHPNSKRQALCNRNPLALWISDDDMKSWPYQRILTDFPGHLAYPDGVIDDREGFVHFAFDYNRHDVIYWGAELPDKTKR